MLHLRRFPHARDAVKGAESQLAKQDKLIQQQARQVSNLLKKVAKLDKQKESIEQKLRSVSVPLLHTA